LVDFLDLDLRHEGHLYIVVIKGTQDEVWLNNALLNFDSTRIEYTDFKTLKITNDFKIFYNLQIVN
jgi:hypothetical protein